MHPILTTGALHAAIALLGSRMVAIFSGFAHAAAPVAIDAVWQGALVVVALVLCLRLAPRVSAAHRFAIWVSAFAMVAALPFLPMALHSSSAAVATSSASHAVEVRPWLQLNLDSRWGFIVAALWLLASTMRAVDLIFHSLRLRRLWQSGSPVQVDAGLRSLLARVFPTRRPIEICTTRELDRPSVIGFFAPRILIPDWLFDRMTPGELEHVALHEAEHLRRRDDWTNLFQKVFLVLFPLNPALAWMEHRLCREREMACDEGVVQRTHAPRAYAACLTSLAERSLKRRAQALSLGAFGRRPELVHRVHSILWRKRVLHPIAARAWVGAVGCGLLFGAVELARCPQMVAFVPVKTSSAVHHLAKAQAGPASTAFERAALTPVRQASLVIPAKSASADELRAPAPYRAIETRAILPVQHEAAVQLPSDTQRAQLQPLSGEAERAATTAGRNSTMARQVLLKAEEPNAAASEQQTGFVIFTAWEQVSTLRHRNDRVADYDTSASSDLDAAAEGQTQSQPAAEVTVTRVILAVYPAESAPKANAKHATDSHSVRPPAIPFDGGWLIFQL
jgi:beta-lactamase regulating signal transducer with metallopeptidase domain